MCSILCVFIKKLSARKLRNDVPNKYRHNEIIIAKIGSDSFLQLVFQFVIGNCVSVDLIVIANLIVSVLVFTFGFISILIPGHSTNCICFRSSTVAHWKGCMWMVNIILLGFLISGPSHSLPLQKCSHSIFVDRIQNSRELCQPLFSHRFHLSTKTLCMRMWFGDRLIYINWGPYFNNLYVRFRKSEKRTISIVFHLALANVWQFFLGLKLRWLWFFGVFLKTEN